MHTLFPDAALRATSQIHFKWPAYRTLPEFACCTKFMYVNAGTTTRLLDNSQELEKEHWQKKKSRVYHSDSKVKCSVAKTPKGL